MKNKRAIFLACAIVIAATAAIAQQAPQVTSSVQSGIGVVMPVAPDTPVGSDGSVGSPPSYGDAGDPQVSQPYDTGPSQGVPDATPYTPPCGHQDLLGKKITDVDLKAFTAPVRVLTPGAAATMDYNPERLNFIIEEKTDVILEVTCG
jgi:hypothetical protein